MVGNSIVEGLQWRPQCSVLLVSVPRLFWNLPPLFNPSTSGEVYPIPMSRVVPSLLKPNNTFHSSGHKDGFQVGPVSYAYLIKRISGFLPGILRQHSLPLKVVREVCSPTSCRLLASPGPAHAATE